jgi:hypothetical protein
MATSEGLASMTLARVDLHLVGGLPMLVLAVLLEATQLPRNLAPGAAFPAGNGGTHEPPAKTPPAANPVPSRAFPGGHESFKDPGSLLASRQRSPSADSKHHHRDPFPARHLVRGDRLGRDADDGAELVQIVAQPLADGDRGGGVVIGSLLLNLKSPGSRPGP